VADNQEIGEREQGGETGEREGATGENDRSRSYDPIIGGMLWPLRRALGAASVRLVQVRVKAASAQSTKLTAL
jgi:hypothetical protein